MRLSEMVGAGAGGAWASAPEGAERAVSPARGVAPLWALASDNMDTGSGCARTRVDAHRAVPH